MPPASPEGRLEVVLVAIDAANEADPSRDLDGRPWALVYGERMSAELARLCPDASDTLRVAARGQHVERWKLPRDAYPDGRADTCSGYGWPGVPTCRLTLRKGLRSRPVCAVPATGRVCKLATSSDVCGPDNNPLTGPLRRSTGPQIR